MNNKQKSNTILILLITLIFSTRSGAIEGLTIYTNRTNFMNVCGNSVTEDFESQVPVTDVYVEANFDQLDQYTNNGLYDSGDIQPGIVVSTPEVLGNDIAIFGPAFRGHGPVSQSVYTTHFNHSLDLTFTNATCVGMDVGSQDDPTNDLKISIFDSNDDLMDEVITSAETETNTFFGIVSSIGEISRINLSTPNTEPATKRLEGVDNVTFGIAPITSLTCVGESFEPPFTGTVGINYNSKRVIPVKANLINDQTDDLVGEGDITPPVVNVFFTPVSSIGAADVTDELLPAGAANEDNIFRFDPETGFWVYNLPTKHYSAPGNYIVTAVAGDTTYTIDPVSCTGTFNRKEK